jgi:hypothetical protein
MAAIALELMVVPVVATVALVQNRFTTVLGALPAAAGNALGPAATYAAIGQRVGVSVIGSARVEAGAAVAAGAAIEVDSLGRGITRSSGVAVGRALSAATAAGQLIEVLLIAN